MKKIKGGKKMDRKGISPLIGTVLLIGFTIGLAMLIFTWGGRFVGEVTEETGTTATQQLACIRDVDLRVDKAKLGETTPGAIDFTVTNDGQVSMNGFTARYTYTDSGGVEQTKTELFPNAKYTTINIDSFASARFTSEVLAGISTALEVEILSPTVTDETNTKVVCQDIKESTKVIT